MPFSPQITNHINETLKAGSLNKSKLQPLKLYGLCTTIAHKEDDNVAFLPAVVEAGKITILTADDKHALKIYHKILSKSYSVERQSFGDESSYKSTTDVQLMVYNNSKITGVSKYIIEPLLVFGFPQQLSPQLKNNLGLTKCTISVTGSNFDSVSLFRQEFPGATYFLNQNIELLQIRYRIETIFSTACVDACLCN